MSSTSVENIDSMTDETSRYKYWNTSELIDYIISLDPLKYGQYRCSLTDSFAWNGFDGTSIDDMDEEDLQSAITNLEDRGAIYEALIKLTKAGAISSPRTAINDERKPTEQEQLVIKATHAAKTYKFLSHDQDERIQQIGFCDVTPDVDNGVLVLELVEGWIHKTLSIMNAPQRIINFIVYYHGWYNHDSHVCIKSGGPNPRCFLTPIINISLSKYLMVQRLQMPAKELVASDIPAETLEHCLTYLSHHKDVEPDPLPCPVRSIHMAQIVSDQWDATWIDAFDKKTTFEIILAANGANEENGTNGLDIKSLLHLGCAKIATLVKQLDQTEINRIIEEEERYRREQASATLVIAQNGDNEDNDDDTNERNENEDEEIDEREEDANASLMEVEIEEPEEDENAVTDATEHLIHRENDGNVYDQEGTQCACCIVM